MSNINPNINFALVEELPENIERGTIYLSSTENNGFIKVGKDASTVDTIYDSSSDSLFKHGSGQNSVMVKVGPINASGNYSFAEGYDTTASGTISHAEGEGTTASGYASHTEGSGTIASGEDSHAEGEGTTASGYASHTEGSGTTASGDQSHAEGAGSRSAINNVSGNANVKVYNSSSMHGLNVGNVVSYDNGSTIVYAKVTSVNSAKQFTLDKTLDTSNALNNKSIYYLKGVAYGDNSHVEGLETAASGNYSHAEGEDTTASGDYSHAEGYGTITNNAAEHAQGQFNKSNTDSSLFGDAGNTIHSIGIGTGASTRKNAVEVMQNGDMYINGIGNYDGSNFIDASTLQEVVGNSKMFYGVCDTSAATTDKAVTCNGFTAGDLKEGVMVSVKFGYTNSGAVASLTLAVNDTSAYPIKKIYGTTSSDAGIKDLYQAAELSADAVIPFVFTGSYWLVAGVDMNVNTTYTLNYSYDAGQYKAGNGTYAVTRYSLLMEKPDRTWEKITSTAATYTTATTKTVNTSGFLLNRIRYYGTTAIKADGALIATNVCYSKAASVDMRYSTNCGASPGWAVGDYVYLVGTLGSDGLFYLDTTTWWSNALPSTNDGKLYIRLGLVLADTSGNSTYNISLLDDRLIFYHDGTSVKIYNPGGGGVADLMTSVTYSELKALRDGGSLVPGMQYRITDYRCATIQANTQSAGNAFDIIVTADSSTELNENARAAHHGGDTYFQNCKLEAWELKYCLDNDTSRFAWADSSNGNGVVFYMKDEWNNECPYDFKNIRFKRWAVTEYDKCPSLVVDSQDNDYGYYYGAMQLNGESQALENATYGEDFGWFYTFALKDLATEDWYDYTVVAHLGLKNDEGGELACYDNHLEPGTDEYSSGKGEMAKMLNNIVFFNCFTDLSDTSYADDYSYCDNNRFLGNCHSNTFGNYFQNNSFGNNCGGNTFGNNCYSNSFGNNCGGNTFGNYCDYNSFGNDCCRKSFGNECYQNSVGNYCNNNSFGNGFQNNSFGNNCNSNSFGNYCQSITVFDSVQNCSVTGGSQSAPVKNAQILNGTAGASLSNKLTITFEANKSYTQIAGKNTSGTLKIWNPADLIN